MRKESVTTVLHEATRSLHSDLEKTNFAHSFFGKAVELDAYIGYTRALAIIHATLEGCLDSCDHPLVSRVWSDDLRRLPELLDDNNYFRWKLIPDVPQSVQASLRAASHIMRVSKTNPVALLGCLYVVSGSTKGAVVLAPLVAQALGLSQGHGLSYLIRHSEAGPAEWAHAAAILDESVFDSSQVKSMVETAVFVFQCLLASFEALCSLDRKTMRHMITAYNPEAGNHPMPQDSRDLLAVLRASERCLADYPYFVYRFGQRGRRFTDSDGGWLATLPELGAEPMLAQVDWLGKLLSARGIPRFLLAHHMEILAEELIIARPDQVERSFLLSMIANKIIEKFKTMFSTTFLQKLIAKLQHASGRKNDFTCQEAIILLASAVMDEADGLEGSTQSYLSWIADPVRFPQPWVNALQLILFDMRNEFTERSTCTAVSTEDSMHPR